MTVRVDFYLLPEKSPNSGDKISTACRLIEKAYQAGNHVYVHTESEEQAAQIDLALWTFRDISFVPHTRYEAEFAAPVRIGQLTGITGQHDLMVNLTTEIADFYQQFNRIIEIVPNHEAMKQQARKQYKIYKDAGCELHSHQLEK